LVAHYFLPRDADAYDIIHMQRGLTGYQNLRGRFDIERHPYTKSRIDQIPCVCMCEPLNRFAYQQIKRLTVIAIGYLDLKYLPPPYLNRP